MLLVLGAPNAATRDAQPQNAARHGAERSDDRGRVVQKDARNVAPNPRLDTPLTQRISLTNYTANFAWSSLLTACISTVTW